MKLDIKFSAAHPNEIIRGKTLPCEATVVAVKALAAPDLTDEFVESLDEFDVATIAELREEIAHRLEDQVMQHSKYAVMDQLMEKIVADNPFDVAESLIVDQMTNMIKDAQRRYAPKMDIPVDESTIKALDPYYRPQAIRSIKREAIIAKVAEMHEINVTDEEARNLVEKRYNYPISKMGPDYARYLIEQTKFSELGHRVEEFLLEKQNITVTRLTQEEWDERFKKESHDHDHDHECDCGEEHGHDHECDCGEEYDHDHECDCGHQHKDDETSQKTETKEK